MGNHVFSNLSMVREFKQALKSQTARVHMTVTDRPLEYPECVREFKTSHPALYASAYMDGEPVPSPVPPQVFASLISKVAVATLQTMSGGQNFFLLF